MKFHYLGFAALCISIITLCIFLFRPYSSSELVYVDISKLMQGYKKTATVKEQFNKKAASLKTNLDSMVSGWQRELKIYEAERSGMTPKEVKLKEELLATKQQQINSYQEALQKQLGEEDKNTTQTILNDINDYVKEYGKEKGYKIIFGASGSGNIMYADEGADLTEEVLKGLNERYGKK